VLVDRSVELLEISAAGLLLSAPDGSLRLMASSSETMRVVELFEVQSNEGPCLDCFRSGEPVLNRVLEASRVEWPSFTPVAIDAGFSVVHALALRLRGRMVGALNLFSTDMAQLEERDVISGQALADMAAIAVLQHRAAQEAQLINEQLQRALTTRVVIEQAKGVLAERATLSMDEAFRLLRQYARDQNRRLGDAARGVVDGSLSAEVLATRHLHGPQR
jgi:GAF domain-containing protein